MFKEVFKFEPLSPERLRIVFTKFRLGNTKLSIETGRWFNIHRNERCCSLCNINEIGDEFYLLFQCDTMGHLRTSMSDIRRNYFRSGRGIRGSFVCRRTSIIIICNIVIQS